MGEEKQIANAEVFKIIYEDTPPSRRWNIIPTLSEWAAQWFPSEKYSLERWEKSYFMVVKPVNIGENWVEVHGKAVLSLQAFCQSVSILKYFKLYFKSKKKLSEICCRACL